MPYYSEIEWELLQEDIIFENNLWNFKFPFKIPEINNFIIKRDESYKMLVKIDLEYDMNFSEEIYNMGIIDEIKISSDIFSKEYVLKNCTVLNMVSKPLINSHGLINLSLSPTIILYRQIDLGSTAWIKEWYLNGPKDEKMFNRTISYRKTEICEKELNNCPSELNLGSKFIMETSQKSSGSKYIFCKLDEENDIIISLVPNKMNPEWSNNVCISYASEDYILNKELRKDIENIISFIFGRKLIKIGESYYDSKGYKIKENMLNPFLNNNFNIKNICMSGASFPIPVEYFDPKIEQILTDLINSFIILRDKLDFSTMFINYWNSTFLLPESKIILLAASLESIKKNWFKQKKYKENTTIIDKNIFRKSIKDIKKQFDEKFGDNPEIIGKFNQLNNRSINKSFEYFFKDINMEIGDIEKKTLQYRNKPVHGNDVYSESYLDLIIYSELYHIILNRVILILLGYDGEYILENHIQSNVYKALPYSFDEIKDGIYHFKIFSIDE